jgi:hypothetical protein
MASKTERTVINAAGMAVCGPNHPARDDVARLFRGDTGTRDRGTPA